MEENVSKKKGALLEKLTMYDKKYQMILTS